MLELLIFFGLSDNLVAMSGELLETTKAPITRQSQEIFEKNENEDILITVPKNSMT